MTHDSSPEYAAYQASSSMDLTPLFDRLESWRMAAEMCAADDAFFSSYNEATRQHNAKEPRLCLLMNDVWNWASADAERVPFALIPEVYALWLKGGSDALLVWACKRRGVKPQKPLFDKLKPEIQEQLRDLPRAGDVSVPVGDGKAALFDDGWKKLP